LALHRRAFLYMLDIISLKNEAVAQITEAKSSEELESLRVAYLGRSGKLTLLFKEMAGLPAKKRKRPV